MIQDSSQLSRDKLDNWQMNDDLSTFDKNIDDTNTFIEATSDMTDYNALFIGVFFCEKVQ